MGGGTAGWEVGLQDGRWGWGRALGWEVGLG